MAKAYLTETKDDSSLLRFFQTEEGNVRIIIEDLSNPYEQFNLPNSEFVDLDMETIEALVIDLQKLITNKN